ncbi:MAG: alpha/beta fold hydrolase [Promethearchaeia archaeon]
MKKYGAYWHNYVFDMDPESIEETITERDIYSNNTRIHLNIFDNEHKNYLDTVLFIHGTAVYSRFYAEFLYHLYEKGYRIVAPDMVGHGLSAGERGHFTMKEYLRVVTDVIDFIQEHYEGKIVIMGSSLGGITSLYAIAKEDARLSGAICHNAALLNEKAYKKIVKVKGVLKLFKPLVPFFAKIAPKLKISVWTYLDPYELASSDKFLNTIDKFLEDPLLADKYTLTAIRTQMRSPLPKPLEDITSPVMIIDGEEDVLFSVNYMSEIYERLTCSKKRLEIIPKASHLILQEHINETLGRVTPFLEGIFS